MLMRAPAVYICGGDETPGTRSECPDAVHDHPLPNGYVDASTVAMRRLNTGWRNPMCKTCGIHGWIPPTGSETP